MGCKPSTGTRLRASSQVLGAEQVWGTEPGGSHLPHPFLLFPQCACLIPCDVPTSASLITRSVRTPTPATSQTPWCAPVFGRRARTLARSEGRAWVCNLNCVFIYIQHPHLFPTFPSPNLIPTLTPSPPAAPNPSPSPVPYFHPNHPKIHFQPEYHLCSTRNSSLIPNPFFRLHHTPNTIPTSFLTP